MCDAVQTKAIYDMYGEYGLKEGCVTPEGEKIGGGYFLRMDPERYFEQKLSNTEMLLEARALNGSDVQQSIFSDSHGGLAQPKADKPKDVVVTLDVSLVELYTGSIKEFVYERQIVEHDAKSLKTERRTFQVEVKPGFSESTELVFKKLGNQSPNHVSSSLIVKFRQLDHADFRRSGHDLILKKRITLLQAFECVPCTF